MKEGISTDRGYNTYTLILDGNSPYAGLKMHGEYYSFQLASDGSSIGKNGDGIFAVVASELAPMDVVQSG